MPHTSRAPRRDGKAHSELAASLKGALCDCGATETRRLPGDARGRPRNRARTSRAGVYAGRTVAAFRPFRTQPLRCLGNRQGHRGSRPGLTSLRPRHPPRRQPEPCAWSPYQAPQPSRRNPRPGAQLRCRDDAYILARRTGGQPRGRRGGRGPERRGAEASRRQRRPESTAARERRRGGIRRERRRPTSREPTRSHSNSNTELSSAVSSRRPASGEPTRSCRPSRGPPGRFAAWGTSPPRSSPGWGACRSTHSPALRPSP